MKGIYKIENLINHKVYIGKSVSIKERWKQHINYLNNNNHINNHLQNAWNEYGPDNFKFEIIELCSKDINERETYWINYYGGIESDNTYNIVKGGSGGAGNEEWRQKISSTVKKHYKDGQYDCRKKGTQIWINKDEKNTKINKNQLLNYLERGWKKGRVNFIIKNKPDTSGPNNHFYGKHHTEETKKKMHKNHIISEDVKQRISKMRSEKFKKLKWINNGLINKRVVDLELYIKNGWKIGRLPLPQISETLKKYNQARNNKIKKI